MLKSLSTKTLLSWGILASVAHPLANLLIATTRTGFDISIHPISLLSLGNFGWMQISNFVISGLLILGFSIGLKKSIRVGVGKVWGPRFLGLYGFVLIAAGIFTVDPMYGYPQGAPTGLPTELSWHAIVHNLTFFPCVSWLNYWAICIFRKIRKRKQAIASIFKWRCWDTLSFACCVI